jgi:2-C-methyl-D-erythritol 4-phosphate cytidylyltransferase
MAVVALVLAAGQGTRLGEGRPKALVRLAGRTLLERSASALAQAPGVDAVLPVIPEGVCEALDELRRAWRGPARLLEPVVGGATRQASVCRGLDAVRRQIQDPEWVLVHDAARALVEPGDAASVLEAARASGAALPVIPVDDTLKELDGSRVLRTPDRSRMAFAQTPQAFRFAILEEALGKAERDGFQGTDCSSLVERIGVEVQSCPGRSGNFKLTHPEDLAWAEILLARGGGS